MMWLEKSPQNKKKLSGFLAKTMTVTFQKFQLNFHHGYVSGTSKSHFLMIISFSFFSLFPQTSFPGCSASPNITVQLRFIEHSCPLFTPLPAFLYFLNNNKLNYMYFCILGHCHNIYLESLFAFESFFYDVNHVASNVPHQVYNLKKGLVIYTIDAPTRTCTCCSVYFKHIHKEKVPAHSALLGGGLINDGPASYDMQLCLVSSLRGQKWK